MLEKQNIGIALLLLIDISFKQRLNWSFQLDFRNAQNISDIKQQLSILID
jgi:hypothetical protein